MLSLTHRQQIARNIIREGLATLENSYYLAASIEPEHGGPTAAQLTALLDELKCAQAVASELRKLIVKL